MSDTGHHRGGLYGRGRKLLWATLVALLVMLFVTTTTLPVLMVIP